MNDSVSSYAGSFLTSAERIRIEPFLFTAALFWRQVLESGGVILL
jgi:hypothetical protein